MKIKDFDFYKDLIRKEAGLYLSSDQPYVLSSRLTQVAKEWNFKDLDHMTLDLRGLPDEKLIEDVVGAMTNSETSFFRDLDFFNDLRDEVIPEIIAKKSFDRTVKIWCAGCSTGQEAYSIALLFTQNPLKEYTPTFKYQIDATDISRSALEKAVSGSYTQLEVQSGIPSQMLIDFFDQEEKLWIVKPEIKKNITFSYSNLISNMQDRENYDLILCRNVLEEFDHIAKTEVLDNLSTKLQPNGYIGFGSDDVISGFTDRLAPIENLHGFYKVPQK